MNLKALITPLVLASTAIAGVASADPIIRDHRYQQQPQQHVVTRRAPATWTRNIRVQSRPSWMVNASANVDYGFTANPNVNYGFQVDRDGDEAQPYTYGQDPYVEGIARNEWSTLGSGLRLTFQQTSQVDVPVDGRPLQSIELTTSRGSQFIREVDVELVNGREIKLTPNRGLDTDHSPNLRLDLGSSARSGVRIIEVFGEAYGKGSFDIIGA